MSLSDLRLRCVCRHFYVACSSCAQDIEAWVPPTPPGKVLLETLAASAEALFGEPVDAEGSSKSGFDGGQGMRGGELRAAVKAAAHSADMISRG